jgi:hypothetical protein
MRLPAPVLLAVAILLGALPARAVELAAHRALYRLTLENTRGGDVVSASGKMTYSVTDACSAWAVQQRLDMTLTNRDGQDVHMVSDYATWESKDGKRIRFHMRQMTDNAVTQQVEGEARLDHVGGKGVVHYTAPDETTMELPPGTLFPMYHTAAIISAAEKGRRFLAVPLFDGTGPDGAQDSFIVVTHRDKPGPAPFKPLEKLSSYRVHIGFFDRDDSTMLPDYEVAMRYWQNGVADDLSMDFGDFVMHGKMAEFKLQPGHC